MMRDADCLNWTVDSTYCIFIVTYLYLYLYYVHTKNPALILIPAKTDFDKQQQLSMQFISFIPTPECCGHLSEGWISLMPTQPIYRATNLTVENSHSTRPTSKVPSWLAPPATHRHSEVAPWRPEMGDSIVTHGMTSDPDERPKTNSVSLDVFSPKWPENKWVHCLFNILKWSLNLCTFI